MRRAHVNGVVCFRMNPASFCLTAGKDQRIDFPLFDHTELQIAVEWRGRYRSPHGHLSILAMTFCTDGSFVRCDLSKMQGARSSVHPAIRLAPTAMSESGQIP
jgi:hypothetical protein